MEDNQINDSLQVNSGRRFDWRQNNWPSVDAAEQAITGTQRITGMLIPVDMPNGLTIQHHFVNNRLVPYDGRVNQPDGVLVDGFTLNDAKTEATLEGTEWRINDIIRTLPYTIIYPIPAPDAGGLIRIDRIKLDASGPTYMIGEPGISAVAKPLIFGEILLRDITVSLADITSTEEPPVTSDNQLHYVLAIPAASFGKVGDVAKINQPGADYGKEYKKKPVNGIDTWVLEYTPAAGGGSSNLQASTVVFADFEPDLVTVNDPAMKTIKTMEVRGIGSMIPETDFTTLVGGGFTINYPGFEATADTAISILYTEV